MPMLTDELLKKLDGISDGSVKGYPVKNLYRLMYTPELWMVAYSNLQSNKGAMTKGVNEDTLDGFSKARVDGIIQKLREGTYEPNPVRRTSIPKSNGNSRPLGIPRGTDKLVQEVARIILERIYEPVFSDFSHGFRPKRSCHTVSDCVKMLENRRWENAGGKRGGQDGAGITCSLPAPPARERFNSRFGLSYGSFF